jgi:hypothetical protein
MRLLTRARARKKCVSINRSQQLRIIGGDLPAEGLVLTFDRQVKLFVDLADFWRVRRERRDE